MFYDIFNGFVKKIKSYCKSGCCTKTVGCWFSDEIQTAIQFIKLAGPPCIGRKGNDLPRPWWIQMLWCFFQALPWAVFLIGFCIWIQEMTTSFVMTYN